MAQSQRTWHYLKPTARAESPRFVGAFDCESVCDLVTESTEHHHFAFAYLLLSRRLADGSWSEPREYHITHPSQFPALLEEVISPKTCLTLLSHNASYDFRISQASQTFHEAGWVLTKALAERLPFCMEFRKGNRKLRWLCGLNWWRCRLEELGKRIGLAKVVYERHNPFTEEARAHCVRDCLILLRTFQDWLDYLKQHDLGSFSISLPAQAFTAFRHRFMRHKILIDCDPEALDIARKAYHGALNECRFVGAVREPVWYLDINSMYPAIMQANNFPTILRGTERDMSPVAVAELLQHYCCVAEVSLDTDKPLYPTRAKQGAIFPIGKFVTHLTSPELSRAITHGHVQRIHRLAYYEKAPIFRDFVDELYSKRLQARLGGDEVMEYQLKIVMNSLYGKFGARGNHYEVVETGDDSTWRAERWYDATARRWCSSIQAGRLYMEKSSNIEANESHPAIAAHVTAYGRLMLRDLQTTAGPMNWYYCDTDSLLVNEAGFHNLSHLVDKDRLGALKIVMEHVQAHIWCKKDYDIGGLTKHKGAKHDAVWIDEDRLRQWHWQGLKEALRTGNMGIVILDNVGKHLKRKYTAGTVNADGWVSPHCL